ncbi:hypothetical protein HZH66_003488 [Vespula vulgaris]|uniref:Uncharacterized protein n=1 Tax=Vespula vulgaris TaxID=7454 RepID=A0A834NCW6_VESVU|nr:hypothetical protein HZH66_003488 [Vespula vulgaris]
MRAHLQTIRQLLARHATSSLSSGKIEITGLCWYPINDKRLEVHVAGKKQRPQIQPSVLRAPPFIFHREVDAPPLPLALPPLPLPPIPTNSTNTKSTFTNTTISIVVSLLDT